jgi:hypothetical protein
MNFTADWLRKTTRIIIRLTTFGTSCNRIKNDFRNLPGIARCNPEEESMATTICLINQKGGCGKSSTCFHLAGAFVAEGFRVLLVDVDPQGSLSQGYLGPAIVEALPPKLRIGISTHTMHSLTASRGRC